ncbi:hypothetical protein ATANTOWER_013203 [Ataeniobius toweri]|uniref:Uncharacterized protein n=1 Tax=Ataeniobius toweri TaxID=208326 RepID=A0ABU7BPG2_9TELE|nr:hypothetical protein [Ataeniobius toweri]
MLVKTTQSIELHLKPTFKRTGGELMIGVLETLQSSNFSAQQTILESNVGPCLKDKAWPQTGSCKQRSYLVKRKWAKFPPQRFEGWTVKQKMAASYPFCLIGNDNMESVVLKS